MDIYIYIYIYLCVCMYIYTYVGPEEMTQRLITNTAYFSKGPEFNPQQPHGDSEPSVIRTGALLRKRPRQLSPST